MMESHAYIHTYIHAYVHAYMHADMQINSDTHTHGHVRLCAHANFGLPTSIVGHQTSLNDATRRLSRIGSNNITKEYKGMHPDWTTAKGA